MNETCSLHYPHVFYLFQPIRNLFLFALCVTWQHANNAQCSNFTFIQLISESDKSLVILFNIKDFFFLISVSGRIGGKILSPLLVFTCQRESNHFWKDSRSPLCAPGIYTLPLGKKSSNITVNAASSLPSPLSGSRAPQLKVLPITGCTPGDLETTDPAKLLSAPMKR